MVLGETLDHCSNYHDREQGMDEAAMYFREHYLVPAPQMM